MFNKGDDVYTPERVDVNAGRKKIALVVAILIVGGIIAWNIFSSDSLPGGTPIVQVDKTGQTPGAKMYTPVEQQQILQTVLETDGSINKESNPESVYGNVSAGIEYIFTQLAREDNPKVRDTDNRAFMASMRAQGGWESSFYDEKIIFEMLQLFNLTASKTLTQEEKEMYAGRGVATGDPGETYSLINDGISIENITDGTPYYVLNVVANYKTETSLPVLISVNVSVSNNGRIFAVTPVGIQSQMPEGE